MTCFWVKFTSQKILCLSVSETDQSISSREVITIYVDSFTEH
jgi:hypothetical protein